MSKRFLSLLVVAAPLLAAPALSHALACGDVITSSVTLTADLDCSASGGWVGLDVISNNVVINLNGHTIYGASDKSGIVVTGASDVRIFGPGAIRDFGIGINATHSPKLQVVGVELSDGGEAVILTQSPRSEIAYNEIYRMAWSAVRIHDPRSAPSRTSGHNTILGNTIGKVGVGVLMCGMRAGSNLVQDNQIAAADYAGIMIHDHSGSNVVRSNRMHNTTETGIRMEASNGNTLFRNDVTGATLGVALTARYSGDCHGDATLKHNTIGHKVYENTIKRTDVAFHVGDTLGLGKAVHTAFADNLIDQSDVGFRFEANSHNNYAFGTLFGAVLTPVIDLGTGNSW